MFKNMSSLKDIIKEGALGLVEAIDNKKSLSSDIEAFLLVFYFCKDSM